MNCRRCNKSLAGVPVTGGHKLLCGDSTDAATVGRLLGGVKVDIVFTDPPYGIAVVRGGSIGGDKPFGSVGGDHVVKAGIYAPIIGDNTIETAMKAYAVCAALKPVPPILLWGGNYYAHRLPPTSCWVVWDKETDGNFGDGEIAWCSAKKSVRIFRHKWSGMLKASERGERRVHPTQKPVALAVWAFGEIAPNAKTVLDLFLGSGTTIIAAEMEGRSCYAIELEPKYVDVAVQRWQAFTGKNACNEDGETFGSVANSRRAASGAGVFAGAPREPEREAVAQ